MAARSKVLPVPYFIQPDRETCQSTVLRMFAAYLRPRNPSALRSDKAAIYKIRKTINSDPRRPEKELEDAHVNFRWWLSVEFPELDFEHTWSTTQWEAVEWIVQHIDAGYPVISSVSHASTPGHIILIVGYRDYLPRASTVDFRFVVHDPYGQFDPVLRSNLKRDKRFVGAACAATGGEIGPGQSVELGADEVGRRRGKGPIAYSLISAKRQQKLTRL